MTSFDRHPLREIARELYDRNALPYHNWRHVEACLAELDAVRSLCADFQAMEIALWFHDCIYDPRRSDNEARSAEIAVEAIHRAGGDAELVDRVRQLILDTRHAAIPETAEGRLIVDIDLAIFGQDGAVFDAYDRAIRLEYGHVDDETFRRGRAAVLRQFLARPFIYHTPYFREQYEGSARSNLARAIQRCGGT